MTSRDAGAKDSVLLGKADDHPVNRFHVTVSGPGIDFERDVTQDVAGHVVLVAMGGRSGLQQEGHRGTATLVSPGRGQPVSLREFLNECEARRLPEKVAAIGYFLRDVKKHENFKKDDILTALQEVREQIPRNIWRDLAKTAELGWIATKPGERDAYYVTSTGDRVVEQRFPRELRKRAGTIRRKRAPARSGEEDDVDKASRMRIATSR